MSSKFLTWVDDEHLSNVLDYATFTSDDDRTLGFRAGTKASAIRVNTALRQANLVACALMNIVDPNGTVDFRSSVSSIQTILNTYLTQTLTVANATNATYAQYASDDETKGTIEERLTSLGFKQGEVTGENQFTVDTTSPYNNIIKRQGNYIICPAKKFIYQGENSLHLAYLTPIAKVPANFYPSQNISLDGMISDVSTGTPILVTVELQTDGYIRFIRRIGPYSGMDVDTGDNLVFYGQTNPVGYEGSSLS